VTTKSDECVCGGKGHRAARKILRSAALLARGGIIVQVGGGVIHVGSTVKGRGRELTP